MKKIKVKVFKYDSEKREGPLYETYDVPDMPRATVLDVLECINEVLGEGVAYRSSCGVRRCGQCGVLVNGKPSLACMEPASNEMVIEPLPNFPVLRDLVVDRSGYDRRIVRLRPYLERLTTSENYPENINHGKIQSSAKLGQCIECLLCIAACPSFEAAKGGFAGPSAMLQLAKFAFDPRDKFPRAPMTLSEGIYDCTTCKKCEQVCPMELNLPDTVIEKLRSIVVSEGLGPLKGHKIFAELALKTGRVVERMQTPLLETMPTLIEMENPKETVGFFTGCLADYRLQEVGKALVNILSRNHIRVVAPREQICCGSPLLRVGLVEEAKRAFVERNILAFEKYEVKKVVTACPGCAMTWRKNYPLLSDEVLHRQPEFTVLHISEYLARELELDSREMKSVDLKVTYHDPCHLSRGLGVTQEPREIIKKIPGVKFKEMEKSDSCCGAGGGVRAGRRDLSSLIGNRKPEYFKRTEADVMLTACPFCELQLKDLLGEHSQVLDLVELVQKTYH